MQTVAGAMLFALLALSLMAEAPNVIFNVETDPGLSNDTGGSLFRQLSFTMLLAMIVGVLWACRVRVTRCVPAILVPVLVWCWLSVGWAIDPSVSFRRILFTTIVILSVACLVEILTYRRCIDVLVATFGLVLLIDWLCIGFFPLAVHQPGDEVYQAGVIDAEFVSYWRGIHLEKNEAGAFAAICFILWTHEAVRLKSYLTGVIMSLLAAGFLYQTHSKTSGGFVLVAMAIGLLSHLAYHSSRARKVMLLGVLVGIALLLWKATSLTAYATAVFDDPASFTGRVQIWSVLLDFASDHWLLGAGYGSFWGIGADSPIFSYGSGWITKLYEAHNGYLEVLIQLGVIGLVLTVLSLAAVPLRKLFLKPLPNDVSRSLICSVLAFECLHDLLEASLLDRANPSWVVTLIALCILFKRPHGRNSIIEG